MLRATRKECLEEVLKYNAIIDELEPFMIYVVSPDGKKWVENGNHVLCTSYANNYGQSWKQTAYGDLVERMRIGLEDCFCEACTLL